jgi:hypothetical protein
MTTDRLLLDQDWHFESLYNCRFSEFQQPASAGYAVTKAAFTASAKDRASKRSSGSQRQATSRQRHLVDPKSLDAARLNMVVSISAKRALERLAGRYGVTQRGIVERLIFTAETAETERMSVADQKRYYATRQDK